MDFEKIEEVFRRAALIGGAEIMAIYDRGDVAVDIKADDSPVTEADRAADIAISDILRAELPDITLVTEEQAESHRASANTFLIVDPLDGTREFIQRRGDFTVNIALVENGVPIRGVVYAPAKGRLFYTRSDAVTVEETHPFDPDRVGECKVIKVRQPTNEGLYVVASKSHRDPATDAYISKYQTADLKSAGSSLKFCLVAAGEADIYPRLGPTMEWDTAAGDAVLRGAGGAMVDFETHEPFTYGKAGYRNGFFIAFAPGVELQSP